MSTGGQLAFEATLRVTAAISIALKILSTSTHGKSPDPSVVLSHGIIQTGSGETRAEPARPRQAEHNPWHPRHMCCSPQLRDPVASSTTWHWRQPDFLTLFPIPALVFGPGECPGARPQIFPSVSALALEEGDMQDFLQTPTSFCHLKSSSGSSSSAGSCI